MTSTGATAYCFGEFRLNPLARELSRNGEPIDLAASAFDCLVYLIEHRERPVGKDELISAVWGRVDVSDNLLAQTIVRLRRALGDAGNEQRCIKTVARVGYRWMLETQVLQQTPALPEAAPMVVDDARGDEAATGSRWKTSPIRRPLLIALACTLLLGLVYAGWQRLSSRVATPNFQFNRSAAVVLPVDVKAPDDWNWLHLGMMDMIASRLRDAKVPTESSQAVLDLLRDSNDASGAKLSAFALVVHPSAELSGDRWRVHLDARSQDGRTWKAEASSNDVMEAAHTASDLLLAQLGYTSGNGSASSGGSVAQYLQRIDAARLAGQPQVARELIEKAPPEVRNNHEVAYLWASLDCDDAKMDSCRQKLEALLKQLPSNQEPVLRGEILTVLGSIYMDQRKWAESSAALDEAVGTLRGQKNFGALATAYLNRARANDYTWKLEEATADIGRARVNYAVAGDLVGVAKSDFVMGDLALRRSQPEAAATLMQHAYDQFVSMGMRSMLLSTLDGLAYAQQMLLKFPDELATTDRFWPLEEKGKDFGFIGDDMRHEMTWLRATALADNGRTAEAKALLERVLSDIGPEKEPGLRAQAYKWLARLALDHGDNERAATLAANALTPVLEEDDQRDYAETWLTRISALQRVGKIDQARHEIAAMVDWESRLPVKSDWTHIYALRAMAAQAWIDGNRDKAIEQFKLAMDLADKLGVPEVIVSVGKAYALALLDTGHVDQAVAVSGRLSAWSDVDWRAAWVEARVYQALGQTDSWEKSRSKAQQLAGDRPLPTAASAVEF
ncbi:transcriptional regulator [Dyella humi]|uniref:Transcriptional regulator n=1 Tax=Dyella humi TaxID=1770547 RepID=A0ABW8IGM8_9GAMM